MTDRTAAAMSSLPQQDVYYEVAREDVAPFVPRGARSALDVGCSRGGFGPTLRHILGSDARIVGIDAVPSQAAIAREGHGYDEVIEGYFPGALDGRDDTFDAIFFNDVLEHVNDPWSLLEEVQARLSPGGKVIAAIPNVQVADNLTALLRGRWDYTDHGILDRTHVRFFTRATMMELFEQRGYRVESCRGANPIEMTGSWKARSVRWLLIRIAPDSRYLHFVIVATADPDRGEARVRDVATG